MNDPKETNQHRDTIRDVCHLSFVTQRRFAQVMGVNESTLSRILAGKMHVSRLMMMAAVCAALSLGVRIDTAGLAGPGSAK